VSALGTDVPLTATSDTNRRARRRLTVEMTRFARGNSFDEAALR
jgi:hypothetical protein